MRASSITFVAAFAAAMASIGGAHADDDPKLVEAKDLFRRGVALYDVGDYDHALAEFRHSHDVFPSAENTLNIAVCLEKLGRFDEALDAYEEVLGRTHDVDEIARVRRAMALIIPNVGALEITANVNGSIVVDGRPRGELPLAAPLRVLPGAHRIRIIKDGYKTFETIAVIDVRVSTRVDASLSPLEPIAAPVRVTAPTPDRVDEGPSLFSRIAAISALELGFATGIALPFGRTQHDRALSDDVPALYPLIGSAGLRIKALYVGAFAQWADLQTRDCCGKYADVRVGVEGAYHFRSARRIHPWIGAAISYEWMTRPLHWGEYQFAGTPFQEFDGFDQNATPGASETYAGLVGSVRGGTLYRFTRALDFGPFFDGTLGRYTSYSATRTTGIPLQPGANPGGKTFHVWITFGFRASFDLGTTPEIL